MNQDVIEAIVSRELAKAQVKADAEMAKLAAQIEKEALKAS